MADFRDLPIRFIAPVTFVPRRGRKEQTIPVRMSTVVRIPAMPRSEAPLVVDVRVGDGRIQRREVGGVLMEPIRLRERNEDFHNRDGFTFERVADDLHNPNRSGSILYRGAANAPWSPQMVAEARADVPEGAAIVRDERERVLSQVHDLAAELAVVDGKVLRRERDPYLVLAQRSPHSVSHGINSRETPLAGAGFRLDRLHALQELTAAARETPGIDVWEEELDLSVDLFDHALMTFREDRHNADRAILTAFEHVKPRLADCPPEALHLLADAKRLHLGLAAGTTRLSDVAAILDDLHAAMPRDFQYFHGNLSIMLKAIALSLPSPEMSPIEDDDLDALQGLRA